jgi:hypothetical protein
MRLFPHLHLPPWIRGRILPTLDERGADRPPLEQVLKKGLREERRKKARANGTGNPG